MGLGIEVTGNLEGIGRFFLLVFGMAERAWARWDFVKGYLGF